MTVIRWATWWPAPYWIPRFECLATKPGIEFEAVFLSARSARQSWTLEPECWAFPYTVASPSRSERGYYRPSIVPNGVGLLVRGPQSTQLVMPYADAAFVAAAVVARAKNMRYHLFVANTTLDERPVSAKNEFVKRLVFSGASTCLATGPLQVEYARRYVRGGTPVAEIGNPVDTDALESGARAALARRDTTRRSRGWDDSLVLLTVARLAQEKDIPTLLEAAAGLVAREVPVRVAVAGSGPLEPSLRAMADELAIRVDFLGFLEGAELADAFAGADVFVLPSLSEPWGLVVNEAMQYGLPTVVSDRVGSKHLLSDGAGIVYPAGDAAALEGVLYRMAYDAERRAELGRAARASIERETVSAWTRAVLDTLEGLDA